MKTSILLMTGWLLGSSLAHAGADSSGGGELIKDALNPWFVQNTVSVSYCIDQDERSFRQSVDQLDHLVREAVDFWKREVARVSRYMLWTRDLNVATQAFVRVGCDRPDVDLRFQFGTLSPEQRAKIADPREVVAVAMRTNYDPVYLKGAGFIYVSPDNGPDRYRGEWYIDGAWQRGDGGRLYKVLIHELGHVFGMPHFGDETQIMGAGFPEHLVGFRDAAAKHDRIRCMPRHDDNCFLDLLSYDRERDYFGYSAPGALSPKLQGYLGSARSWFQFVLSRDGVVEILDSDSEFGTYEPLGKVHVGPWRVVWSQSQTTIQVYLTPEQRALRIVLDQPMRNTVVWSAPLRTTGSYVNERSGLTQPMEIELRPDGLRIGGVIDGVIYPTVYNSDQF